MPTDPGTPHDPEALTRRTRALALRGLNIRLATDLHQSGDLALIAQAEAATDEQIAELNAAYAARAVLQPTPVEAPPVTVDVTAADEDDRLAALYRAYPQAKADADEAKAALEAIVDGIKLEVTTRLPENTKQAEVRGPGGKPLRLAYQVTNRFNTKRFAKDHAAVYEAYREPSGSWKLEAIRGGE